MLRSVAQIRLSGAILTLVKNTTYKLGSVMEGKHSDTRHPLNLGGSNCQTIALSESLNISPLRHQDSRKNRGKKIPLRNFCKTTYEGGQRKNMKIGKKWNFKSCIYIISCSSRKDNYKNYMR